MSNVVKLASSQDRPATRACGACRYRQPSSLGACYDKCTAWCNYCDLERSPRGRCGIEGRSWEAMPVNNGILARAWRWVFG